MPLRERLINYFRNNHGWIAKGQICDLAREKTGATGENTGRRLRELVEDNVLEVQIRKRHAHYRIKSPTPTLF